MTSYLGDQFVYDALNMVTKSQVGGVWRTYIYNASDERIGTFELASGGAVARSEWTLRDSGNQVLRRLTRDTSGNWGWVQDYVYRNGQMLASEVAAPVRRYQYHIDHLGTPRLITGNGGIEISRHNYYPFGRESTSGAADGERKQFTGHERDPGSIDYMHARYYHPFTGRFLSVDPARSAKPRLPQTWNRYAYARNNPLVFIDPNGETEIRIVVTREPEVEVTYVDKSTGTGTPGTYTVSGGETTLEGYTLERPDNGNQKLGRIPAGTYDGEVSYSPKFKRDLLEVMNVSGRSRILFHSGNDPGDTEGCILVGQGRDAKSNRITTSKAAEKALNEYIETVKEADKKKKEETTIVIEVRDPKP